MKGLPFDEPVCAEAVAFLRTFCLSLHTRNTGDLMAGSSHSLTLFFPSENQGCSLLSPNPLVPFFWGVL